ncbi:MAG: GtrA family protein [Chitinophagaceae bacterium]
MVHNLVTDIIDFFYRPFKKWVPLQTFRYAACGGGNMVLGFLLYTISYKFIFKEQIVDLGFYAFKPHIAALIFSFLINFPVGFLLMKYVVFIDSNIRGRVQLFRYFFVFVSNLFINYLLLKVLVEYLYVNAIVAQVISTAVVVTISYLLQRHFTFKVEDTGDTGVD